MPSPVTLLSQPTVRCRAGGGAPCPPSGPRRNDPRRAWRRSGAGRPGGHRAASRPQRSGRRGAGPRPAPAQAHRILLAGFLPAARACSGHGVVPSNSDAQDSARTRTRSSRPSGPTDGTGCWRWFRPERPGYWPPPGPNSPSCPTLAYALPHAAAAMPTTRRTVGEPASGLLGTEHGPPSRVRIVLNQPPTGIIAVATDSAAIPWPEHRRGLRSARGPRRDRPPGHGWYAVRVWDPDPGRDHPRASRRRPHHRPDGAALLAAHAPGHPRLPSVRRPRTRHRSDPPTSTE